jgi:hypothetical protein
VLHRRQREGREQEKGDEEEGNAHLGYRAPFAETAWPGSPPLRGGRYARIICLSPPSVAAKHRSTAKLQQLFNPFVLSGEAVGLVEYV